MKVGKLEPVGTGSLFAEPYGFDCDGLGHCQVEHSEAFDRCMRSNPSQGKCRMRNSF